MICTTYFLTFFSELIPPTGKDNEMSDGDNLPIGLILCGSKGEALAKYATSGMDNQLFVSKYLVQLPDKKVLENFIKKEIGE
jgi:hypothetical protein